MVKWSDQLHARPDPRRCAWLPRVVRCRRARQLAPRYWGAHLLAVALVAVAVGLGLWQLDAWQARRAAEAADLTRRPGAAGRRDGPRRPVPGRPGRPAGDGRGHLGARGHRLRLRARARGPRRVLGGTPLAIDGPDDPALPVVRGWVAAPDEAPAPPTGTTELVAWLQPTQGTGDADADPADDVLPQVRTADLIQHVDQDLYGAYARRRPSPTTGWSRPPRPAARGRPVHRLRNLLYAIEWWFFGRSPRSSGGARCATRPPRRTPPRTRRT